MPKPAITKQNNDYPQRNLNISIYKNAPERLNYFNPESQYCAETTRKYLRKCHTCIQIKLHVLKKKIAFHNPCSFVIEGKKSFIDLKDTGSTVDIAIINTNTIM